MKTETTKEKIIALGRVFLQTYGYHSFKYQQIADVLQIKNAAIHHYFPAKEDLGVAIIEKIHSEFIAMSKKTVRYLPEKKTEVMIKIYRGHVKDGLNLCIIGVCVSAYTELPEKMKTAAKLLYNDLLLWLTESFDEGINTGDFDFKGTAEDLARHWLVSMAGSIQLAKMTGIKEFESNVSRIKMLYLKQSA